jgi:Protein of unknown function (DUF3082)
MSDTSSASNDNTATQTTPEPQLGALAPPTNPSPEAKPLTPLRCLVGATIAGALGFAMYSMMTAIAVSFASHKIQSDNLAVLRISAAVRTLVLGLVTMGTGVFSLATLGLIALAIQLAIQRAKQPSS